MVERDDWLSEVLRRPVWRVELSDSEPDTAMDLEDSRRGFYYVKIPVCSSRVQEFSRAGYRLVTTAVTMERNDPEPNFDTGFAYDLRPASAKALEELWLRQPWTWFRYDRFHADPELSPEDGDAVKRLWLWSYRKGERGDEVLLARTRPELCGYPPKVCGFLCVQNASAEPTIDLVAVHPETQGTGVGASLVSEFLLRWGRKLCRVTTQLTNRESIRLYERFGFRFETAHHVLHRHVN